MIAEQLYELITGNRKFGNDTLTITDKSIDFNNSIYYQVVTIRKRRTKLYENLIKTFSRNNSVVFRNSKLFITCLVSDKDLYFRIYFWKNQDTIEKDEYIDIFKNSICYDRIAL